MPKGVEHRLLAEIIESLEQLAPPALSADWDNTGLLLGNRQAAIERIMTCLTITPATAAEALAAGHSPQGGGEKTLVVSHHPVLFRGVKRLTDATPEGQMVLSLLRGGVAVYSPHTSWDNADGGINDHLAQLLALGDVVPLRRRSPGPTFKLVVFVPDKDLQRVSDALFAAGAGEIGHYRECSFRLAGTGTFFGTDATNPTVGQKGRREEVAEWRLEVVCAQRNLAGVLTALRQTRYYEEPAFDVYPLQPDLSKAAGEGRVGVLPQPLQLGELALRLKQRLGCGPIQVVGSGDRLVSRVAIVCGAGGELLEEAVRARADVFLTGEMRYHDYLAAQAKGIALVFTGASRHRALRCGTSGGVPAQALAGTDRVGQPGGSRSCFVGVKQCSVFSVQCSVFSVQCSVFSVQCSVFS